MLLSLRRREELSACLHINRDILSSSFLFLLHSYIYQIHQPNQHYNSTTTLTPTSTPSTCLALSLVSHKPIHDASGFITNVVMSELLLAELFTELCRRIASPMTPRDDEGSAERSIKVVTNMKFSSHRPSPGQAFGRRPWCRLHPRRLARHPRPRLR
jgi:hypothetical protein